MVTNKWLTIGIGEITHSFRRCHPKSVLLAIRPKYIKYGMAHPRMEVWDILCMGDANADDPILYECIS